MTRDRADADDVAASRRRQALLLAALLACGALLLAAGLTAELPGEGGTAHPEVPAMRYGGPGAAPRGALLFWAWGFGAATFCLFGALIAFATRRRSGLRRVAPPLAAVVGLMLALWTAIVLTSASATPTPVFGLPPASAILLFVFWPALGLFTWLYPLGFRSFVLTPEDEADLERLLAGRRTGAGPGEPEAPPGG